MAYNVLEGVVALWSGLQAGSIALVGFGFDSFIECAAATALFWRLGVEAKGADLHSPGSMYSFRSFPALK
jgi:hypothetical protein